ncbi:hypothetical protein CARUB_v10018016mg [Capsella rubella]|uniref:Shugoshin C-terminal domain-containing protein n=1 Tax=Capsella rubella TaxID=81985 RepID=R0FRA3_9BRAS|nr:hypothetical protein CARUB_v10018016mg [Capsella rubella]
MRHSLSDITNSQPHQELNTGFESREHVNRLMKVKALHHEVNCKNALLKAKFWEQERGEKTQPRNALSTEKVINTSDEDSSLETPSPRPFVPNRRRFIRSKSIGASTTHKIEAEKEKSETKRRRSRRRTARVRSATYEETENLFEIEDLELTMPPNEICRQDKPKMASHTRKKEDLRAIHQDCKVHKSPVDQPLRRAAEKIHPYMSFVTNMRRS